MKKIIVTEAGGPEVLELVTVPTPDLPSGHVIVDVEAAGVNYVDVENTGRELGHQKPLAS